MNNEIVIHGFETSNNMKVRVALGFKEIPYEFRTIDPKDRTALEELSGQYLTPVMVHGDTVLFDSAAILRYLDANFRHTPRLFGNSHREQWEIEDWELFARLTMAGPLMEIVHHRVYGGTVDDEMQRRCDGAFAAAVDKLVAAMNGREWLVGDALTAADVTAAVVMYRVLSSPLLSHPPAADSLQSWIDRVMVFDSHLDRPAA